MRAMQQQGTCAHSLLLMITVAAKTCYQACKQLLV